MIYDDYTWASKLYTKKAPKGFIENDTKRRWSLYNVKCDYKQYTNTTNCELCNNNFNDCFPLFRKCIDYNRETGEVNRIVCRLCANTKYDTILITCGVQV